MFCKAGKRSCLKLVELEVERNYAHYITVRSNLQELRIALNACQIELEPVDFRPCISQEIVDGIQHLSAKDGDLNIRKPSSPFRQPPWSAAEAVVEYKGDFWGELDHDGPLQGLYFKDAQYRGVRQ